MKQFRYFYQFFPVLYANRKVFSSSFRNRGTVSLVQNDPIVVDYSSCREVGSLLTILLEITRIQLIFMGGVDVNVLFQEKKKNLKNYSPTLRPTVFPLEALSTQRRQFHF